MITLTITIEEDNNGDLNTSFTGQGIASQLEIAVAQEIRETVNAVGERFGKLVEHHEETSTLPMEGMPTVQN